MTDPKAKRNSTTSPPEQGEGGTPPEPSYPDERAEGAAPYETYLGSMTPWQVAALKAYTRWPDGYAVTPDEFQAAHTAALQEAIE